MSQEKVDQYKKYKTNKSKILRKAKWMRRIELGIAALVCVFVIGWIGFGVYSKVTTQEAETAEKTVTEIDATAIDNFLQGLSADDTAQE